MPDDPASSFAAAFCARVRERRLAKGWTQEQMAKALGITPAAYSKNETRSPLPHHLIERFCLITETDIVWLMTGRKQGRASKPRRTRPEQQPEV